jgi:Gram-negative bacterial TonB protein C-terminal
LIATSAVFVSPIAFNIAQAEEGNDDLPTVTVLPCTERCISVTKPVGISQPKPIYPSQFGGWYDTYVEGLVQLQYTIGLDGHVSNTAVVRLVGPRQFAEYTEDAVKTWTYKPAQRDSQPISVSHKLLMFFRAPNVPQGARPQIVRTYSSVQGLMKDNKLDEAFVKLSKAEAEPKLNFYERAMLANLSAFIAINRKDYRQARRLVDQPTFY